MFAYSISVGVYEVGGYAHLLTVVKLSVYREAVRGSCGHLHGVAKKAHLPGMGHLYEAVELMEKRCKQVESTANSQLRAMGSDEEWRKVWTLPGENPFATKRGTLSSRPSQAEVQIATNILRPDEPEMPTFATDYPSWPRRFTKKYVDWCESRVDPGMCCVHRLFMAETPITDLSSLPNCTMMVIPEAQLGSPYYNPLFMPKEALRPLYRTGNLTAVVDIYEATDEVERQERFVTAMALAGGTLFGAAMDSVLGWFGYSLHTTEDVKHINANQEHLDQVAHQVELTEKFSKSIQEEAHNIEHREELTEDFLHLMVGLQSLFDHMELISSGLSTLFHHRRLSPLLIDRNAVVKKVRDVQMEQRAVGHELMVSPGDVWHCPVSYVVTRDLNIHIMVHVPVGKTTSYRKVFRYIPTPLSFGDDDEHFMVNPRNPFLLLDTNGQHPTEMSENEMTQCEMVNHYKKYCPGRSVLVNRAPPSCLSALQAGDQNHVLKMCPIVLVDEDFPYVATLAFGIFTVYSKSELTVKIYCGEAPHGTQVLKGLNRITLRRDCRLVHQDFVLEPTIDFTEQDNELTEVPLKFDDDLNMSQVLGWGAETGLLRTSDGKLMGEGLTMLEVSEQWSNEKLDETRRWSLMMYLAAAGGSLLLLICCCCCTREGWNCYMRARQRNALAASIRQQVREAGQEMQLLARGGSASSPSAPSAPAETSY